MPSRCRGAVGASGRQPPPPPPERESSFGLSAPHHPARAFPHREPRPSPPRRGGGGQWRSSTVCENFGLLLVPAECSGGDQRPSGDWPPGLCFGVGSRQGLAGAGTESQTQWQGERRGDTPPPPHPRSLCSLTSARVTTETSAPCCGSIAEHLGGPVVERASGW